MKIYLAGNFQVMNTEGRERELHEKFGGWRRLLSYWFFLSEHGVNENIYQIFEISRE